MKVTAMLNVNRGVEVSDNRSKELQMQSVQQVQNAELSLALNNKRRISLFLNARSTFFVPKHETRILTQEHVAHISKCEARISKFEACISNAKHETRVSIKECEAHVPTKGRKTRASNVEREARVSTSRRDARRPEQPREPYVSNAKHETHVHETHIS